MKKARARRAGVSKPGRSSRRGPAIHRRIRLSKSEEDLRLSRVTEIALALPETSRETYSSHAAFAVRKRIFAYFLDNHHDDGIVGLTCKVLPGDNDALIRGNPKKFYAPAYLAHRGWVALRLDAGKIDWKEVTELVATSYQLCAPRSISAKGRSAR